MCVPLEHPQLAQRGHQVVFRERVFRDIVICAGLDAGHCVVGILAARQHRTALTYLLVGGIAYAALFLLGLLGVMDWLPADDTDDWLHLVLGAALLGAWYASRDERRRSAVAT